MTTRSSISFIVITGFLIWCLISFWSEFNKINFTILVSHGALIFLAVALSLLNYALRACRWFFYLSQLGHTVPFRRAALVYIAGFAFTLSPAKLGEIMRGRYLKQYGITQSDNVATFFVERILDLLVMIALASLVAADFGHAGLMWTTLIVIVILVAAMSLMPWNSLLNNLYLFQILPRSLHRHLLALITTLISSKVLLNPIVLIMGFVLGMISWGGEGLGFYYLSQIPVDVQLNVETGIGIYAIAIIVGALSFLPGGLGSTEVVMAGLLSAKGFALPDVLLITFLCRFLTLWFAIILGWIAVFLLRANHDVQKISLIDSAIRKTPLCVDLDGTLIKTDLLLETFVTLIKKQAWAVFFVPFWLFRGKAVLKAEIAMRVSLNPAVLPYNQLFLEWLIGQKQNGRPIYLCTASNYRLANLVADHLGIFDRVFASSDTENLSGARKAICLVNEFGSKGFDYCGNHPVDCEIWAQSEGAIVVNGSKSLENTAAKLCDLRAVFMNEDSLITSLFRALRPHQWVKNILIFVPILTAHRFMDLVAIEQVMLAFVSFGFCASSVYVLNDMLDLEADRQHSRKSKRPFASGSLSLVWGVLLIPSLLLLSVLFASKLPEAFWLVLACYYCLTIAYSFHLKRLVLVDAIVLAALYTARIIAGGMAISVPMSFWLILFSVFLFLSLALVKRYAELDVLQKSGRLNAIGRGYYVEDLPIIHSLGTASGYLCVLVLALYINTPTIQSLYRYPETIWLLCVLLLYWISRIWLKTHRGQMHDDPVVFALKDKTSICIGVLFVLLTWMAI